MKVVTISYRLYVHVIIAIKCVHYTIIVCNKHTSKRKLVK